MSFEELKKAISELSSEELKEFRQWLAEFEASHPDRFVPEYASPEAARAANARVFEENAELFRKLAE